MKAEIYAFLVRHPKADMKMLTAEFGSAKYNYIAKTASNWRKINRPGNKKSKKKGKSNTNKSPGGGRGAGKRPPRKPNHADTDSPSLNPYIEEVLDIQSAFAGRDLVCNPKDAMLLKDRADQLANTGDMPPWTRPPVLNKRQHEIIDAINDPEVQVVFVEGDKRTGKSTAWFCGVCESIWNGKIRRWGFWSKSEKNAVKIHRDVKNDPISVKYTIPLYKGAGSAMRTLFFNGGYIEVGSTENENSLSGQAYQAVVVDEAHTVVVENPETFGMIAMILRSEPRLKFVLCANQGKTAFQMLKNKLLANIPESKMKFFTLLKEDTTHITDETDALVRVMVEASAGEDMARQFLDNEFVRDGALYYPMEGIQKAYIPYDAPPIEQFETIGAGVDWGDTHDTGIHIAGFLNNEGFEIETIYLQHPDSGRLIQEFSRIIQEYPGIVIVWEGSPLGSFIRNELRKLFPNQRFITSNFTKRKERYIDNLYIWLVDEDIHLKDGKLKRQLIMYKNDKKNDDGHDALAHLYYKAQQPRTSLKTSISFVSK